MSYTNNKVKRLLKSELVKRGITVSELVRLLNQHGLQETKSSVTSKISRGTFSATFFLQCLFVIGCTKLEIEDLGSCLDLVAEEGIEYKIKNKDEKN